MQLFSDAFEKLLNTVKKQAGQAAPSLNRLTYALPEPLVVAMKAELAEWGTEEKVRKLWAGDASLWSGRDEGQWLGWLGVVVPLAISASAAEFFSSVNSAIPPARKHGRFHGQRPGFLKFVSQFSCCNLAGLDVRLIEWMNAKNRASDCCSEFPAEKLSP